MTNWYCHQLHSNTNQYLFIPVKDCTSDFAYFGLFATNTNTASQVAILQTMLLWLLNEFV